MDFGMLLTTQDHQSMLMKVTEEKNLSYILDFKRYFQVKAKLIVKLDTLKYLE